VNECPLPPRVEYVPPILEGKVLVANGDMHGAGFYDMQGNLVRPGECAYFNEAHAAALLQRNRFWQRVTFDSTTNT